ncbi:MAG TPA: SRPBCC domain-containing protein [Solirubrobacteraceae bacterium]|nr:SRPBCC domain-containing protein [Solirubrobacteraceae bacterium]
MSDEPRHALRIERTYAASAEEVFDAWTSAEVLRRWLHAGEDWTTPVAEVDLRVGGTVRVVMRRPDGDDSEMHGEYREIDRPRRLVMAWTFADRPANPQLIELSFSESGGATTVVMVNTDISDEARRDNQERGWRACLQELDRVLAT